MKVLLIDKFYYLYAGPERYLFNLSKLLEENGHQVIIFSMHHERNIPSPYAEYFVSNVDFFADNKNILNYPKIALRAIYSFESKNKIAALIKATKPDVCHLINISSYISYSILHTLRKFKTSVVQTLISFEQICPYARLFLKGKVCNRCRGDRYYNVILNRCNRNNLLASFLTCLQAYTYQFMKIYKNINIFIAGSHF